MPTTTEEKPASICPDERQVIACILNLWQDDPAVELMGNAKLLSVIKRVKPNWSLSANRLKQVMKDHPLGVHSDTSDTDDNLRDGEDKSQALKSRRASITALGPDFQYHSLVTSEETPDLSFENGVRMALTKAKGKTLYSTRKYEQGEVIWSEAPLIVLPPLENVPLMRKSLACAYCGSLFQVRTVPGSNSQGQQVPLVVGKEKGEIPGIGCSRSTECLARWCDFNCRKADISHGVCWHTLKDKQHGNLTNRWLEFEDFCLKHEQTTAYAVGRLFICITKDKKMKSQLLSLARVGENSRLQARRLDIMQDETFSQDVEDHWKRGFELLCAVQSGFDYKEYLSAIGMFNINNFNSQIYLKQTHLNHSCEPNVEVCLPLSRKGSIEVRALKDIARGEELSMSYISTTLDDYFERQHALRINYGFLCNCSLCKAQGPASSLAYDELAQRPRRKSVHFVSSIPAKS